MHQQGTNASPGLRTSMGEIWLSDGRGVLVDGRGVLVDGRGVLVDGRALSFLYGSESMSHS